MCICLRTAGDKWNIKVKYQLKSQSGMILFKTQIFISWIKQELIKLSKSHVESRNSAFLFCCSFGVNNKTSSNLYTVLSSNTTEERFNSTRRTEGRDLYLTEIISDIGDFSHLIDYHGVCSDNNVVSFVTNLLVESLFGKKMQFFMCLVVSSSRLLFTFHLFSFKWVLISILI